MSRIFSIVGDSNIQRHMNPTNCRDRPLMSGSEVIPCGKLSILAEALKSVREESTICVVSCVSNFLTGSKSAGSTVSPRFEPVLSDFCKALNLASGDRPDLIYLVSAPMYRRTPLWYRDSLPEILTKFSEAMKQRGPQIHLLSSFPTPTLEPDGVHLTAYSGLEFVLHLFDAAGTVLDGLSKTVDEAATLNTEAARVLEDRMVAIEQDHRRLNAAFVTKSAEDSELFDFHENIRLQSGFVIEGLTKHPQGMDPKEWQVKVKDEVRAVLSILLGRESPSILFVMNNTSRRKDAPAKYHVQMEHLSDSQEIRDKFGVFFVGGDKRPPALKHIAIRNKVTLATSVSVLKVLGRRYEEENEGSRFQVISYEPRPVLKLHPSPTAESCRVHSYTFIQAIRSLSTDFTAEETDKIIQSVSPKLYGQLRSLFDVINDDMISKRFGSKSSGRDGGTDASAPGLSSGAKTPEPGAVDRSGSDSKGSGSGSKGSGSGSKGSSSGLKGSKHGKNSKRGATSPAGGRSEKHRK